MRSSIDSNARYGLIAPAPYPMSSAMWCTSRASPDSTTRPTLRARLLADEVVVHRGGEQQRRDRRVDRVGVAVGQHDDARALGDRGRRLVADRGRAPRAAPSPPPATRYRPEITCAARPGNCAVVVDVDDLAQLVVVEDRERQLDLTAAVGSGFEQVPLGADRRRHRGDELLADRVERRVRDLREQLLEVVEQQPRPVRTAPRSACRCPSSRSPRRRSSPSGRRGS